MICLHLIAAIARHLRYLRQARAFGNVKCAVPFIRQQSFNVQAAGREEVNE